MKKWWDRYKNIFSLIVAVAVCAVFFVYILTLVRTYSADVNERAEERAEFYTREQSLYIGEQCSSLKREAEFFAVQASDAESEEDFIDAIREARVAVSADDYGVDVLYLKGDKLFGKNGEIAESYSALSDVSEGSTVVSRVFQYNNKIMSIAVSASIESTFADRIFVVYDRRIISVSRYAYDEDGNYVPCLEKSEFTLLCKHDGRVVESVKKTAWTSIPNEPIQDGLVKDLFAESEDFVKVEESLFASSASNFIFTRGNEDYVLSVSPLGVENGSLVLVCAYKVSTVYGDGFTVIQSISAALLGLVLIMAVMIAIIIVVRLSARRKIFRLEMVVPFLNCATPKKFEKTAESLLKRHSSSDFAFVSFGINNFGYVVEHFGEENGDVIAKHVADEIRHALYLEETFAYAGNGEFLMLMHYRERQAFSERLNGLYTRISSFNEFEGGNYKINATFAVYEVERGEKQTVHNMLDKLKIAKREASAHPSALSIGFYEDVMHENYMRKAEIEGKMERALQNSEFHLFYQPKYNLKKKNLDGSEILIRWYDPELKRYHVPGEFLPVFEENGFIVKLDKFVFFKACENVFERVSRRLVTFPISVNVSRITAIQPDFIDYYVRIKNKFKIKDNFITLEFTESFAYENYEFLSEGVDKLHANGFLCSIDDFGTGYSSYNILKTIKMDEIKLDKFFLAKGMSEERDKILLKSVVETVAQLDMKVTQEGVETKEDLYLLENLGCQVIQGYYFAKPMKYSDFCEFVEKNFI